MFIFLAKFHHTPANFGDWKIINCMEKHTNMNGDK